MQVRRARSGCWIARPPAPPRRLISDLDLVLSAIRLSDAKPWYFVKNNPINASKTGSLGLLDCATASAAAPTYFDSWPMGDPVNGKLVDGGVGVTGNPVYQFA